VIQTLKALSFRTTVPYLALELSWLDTLPSSPDGLSSQRLGPYPFLRSQMDDWKTLEDQHREQCVTANISADRRVEGAR